MDELLNFYPCSSISIFVGTLSRCRADTGTTPRWATARCSTTLTGSRCSRSAASSSPLSSDSSSPSSRSASRSSCRQGDASNMFQMFRLRFSDQSHMSKWIASMTQKCVQSPPSPWIPIFCGRFACDRMFMFLNLFLQCSRRAVFGRPQIMKLLPPKIGIQGDYELCTVDVKNVRLWRELITSFC